MGTPDRLKLTVSYWRSKVEGSVPRLGKSRGKKAARPARARKATKRRK
jgi:hypothetical protein